jgi:RimJ/RimL family protein N-acetyltransferase
MTEIFWQVCPNARGASEMIYGERVRFRAVEPDDLPVFVRWINDPEVRRGIGKYLPFAMADEREWYDNMRGLPLDEHNFVIEIQESTYTEAGESWVMIGTCGFFNHDKRNRAAEFGIMIGDKSRWNQGYGTEAVGLLVQHGFNTLNFNRIYLRVLDGNARAIRAYEKAGFIHEGRQRQAEYREGRYSDLLVMSILKNEVPHA